MAELSILSWGLVLLSLWLTYVVGRMIYNVFFHPLSAIPGPTLFATSRIPLSGLTLTGRLPYIIKGLHEKYGDVVRIAPNELAFASAEAWTDIYCNSPSRPCMPKDPILYQVSPLDVHSILTVPANEDHTRYRRVLNYAFSSRSLNQQEPLILGYVQKLISELDRRSAQGPMDMLAWYTFAISDIISDLSFGEPFGSLEAAEYHPWVSLLINSFRFSTYISLSRRFPIFTKLLVSFIPEATARKAAEHDNATRDKIRRRMLTQDGRPDFMQAVLENNNIKSRGMSDAEISSTFHFVLVAGLETTATMITVATYLLLKNPAAMRKVVDEIRSSFEREEDITVSASQKMRYLMGALNEGMRMIPPTPWGAPRIVPGKGQEIAGHWIQGGTTVNVFPYSTFRVPTNFSRPDSFCPERWLPQDHEDFDPIFKNDNHRAFHPFSTGPRNCIGKNLAYAEVALIMTRLLWNFDIRLDGRSADWSDDMKAYIVWEKKPLYVNLVPVDRVAKS